MTGIRRQGADYFHYDDDSHNEEGIFVSPEVSTSVIPNDTLDSGWREWMGAVEAVLFASSSIVSRKVLQRLVGEGVSLDLLIADIQAELQGRPYEIVAVGDGWMFRTKPAYAGAIRQAQDERGDRPREASEMEMAVLCAIAYHQPISRDELKDIFGKEISRDLINRLRHQQMIANGPKAPRPGAPQTFVTTREFLARFDLQSLRDLPEMEESGG